jgi:hypothetical protein
MSNQANNEKQHPEREASQQGFIELDDEQLEEVTGAAVSTALNGMIGACLYCMEQGKPIQAVVAPFLKGPQLGKEAVANGYENSPKGVVDHLHEKHDTETPKKSPGFHLGDDHQPAEMGIVGRKIYGRLSSLI